MLCHGGAGSWDRMNVAYRGTEERSSVLEDTPNSSAQRADTGSTKGGNRDTNTQTTCATLPPEALNGVTMGTDTGAQAFAPQTRVDTMDSMSSDLSRIKSMAPPAKGAGVKDVIEFVKYQLDRIGQDTEILDGLLLLGAGRTERLEGGVSLHCINTHYYVFNMLLAGVLALGWGVGLTCRWQLSIQLLTQTCEPTAQFNATLSSYLEYTSLIADIKLQLR